MLNETWQMLQALDLAGIKRGFPHPLIQPLPASEKNLLRVRLNDSGNAVSVEAVLEEERSGIKRIVRASDGSFPVIKVNQPFLNLAAESPIWESMRKTRSDKGRTDLIAEAVKEGEYRTWTEAGWQWTDSMRKADIIIEKLKDNEHGKDMQEIAVRFKKALKNNTFIADIATMALRDVQKDSLTSIKTFQELFIGKGKDNKGNDKKISVLLILELDNDTSIHQDKAWENISEVLPTNLAATQREFRHSATKSAFGSEDALLEEPFPAVKLPVLGARFPIISMASSADKAKCNKRYGLTEYTVCPVASGESRRMAGALDWLVAKGRRGTTWQSMPNGRFEMDSRTRKKKEKQDLLVVYVADMPAIDIKTASYFGTGADVTEARFEVDAKTICDALRGIVRAHPKSKMNLFLIRKATDGQVQIALAETPMVKGILDGAERWQAGAKNIPLVEMYLPAVPWGKKAIPAVDDAHPLTPYPDQVVRLLSRQWVRDGSSPKGNDGRPQKAAQEIAGPGLSEVLAVMLRKEGKWKTTAQQMLNLLIHRLEPLLVGLFGAQHAYGPRHALGRQEPLGDYPRDSREVALRAVALLGILLDTLEIRKEAYMKEAPFQIGQVLALADTLHKDYCIVVRREQMPNSLIGTSLMRRALDDPAGALADLSERMMEYIRWAKVAQVSQEWPSDDRRRIAVNEARKKLRQYQPLAERLGCLDLPSECNDQMKAQLLLGFLSTPPKEDIKENEKEEI